MYDNAVSFTFNYKIFSCSSSIKTSGLIIIIYTRLFGKVVRSKLQNAFLYTEFYIEHYVMKIFLLISG